MLRRIVECVPNFSEGRDAEVLREIAAGIRSVPGVLLLGHEQDADHHRAVITYVGSPDAVVEAAVRAALVARDRIDLRRHQGVHPRIGALDVLPFIPVQNVTLGECAALAREAARQIWQRCGIPCYLYEAAAQRVDRRNLADVRRGNFEGLSAELAASDVRRPDVGGPLLHPSAGAVAVGARKFLIAWNVLLKSSDISAAREIAALVRQSSGGFPFVKALGLELPSRGITQVSMNLLDFEETPMQPVYDAIQREAAKRGIEVIGSELIGFVPRKALEANVRHSLQFLNLQPDRILENRIESLEGARSAVPSFNALNRQPLESALLGLHLLSQAAVIAARCFHALSGSTAGEAITQGEPEALALAEEITLMVQGQEGNHHPPQADSWDARLLHYAEQCVELKSRLAAEKQRFLASSLPTGGLAQYQAAWHLAEASLRCFLLHFATLETAADAEFEPPGSFTSRLRALRQLQPS